MPFEYVGMENHPKQLFKIKTLIETDATMLSMHAEIA